MEPLKLDDDRFFDPEPQIRRIARQLYDGVRELPLVCPHGHVDPEILARNEPFAEPASLLITPDHYIFRMLYSQGVPLESLGIPTRDSSASEGNPRKVWRIFAQHYYLFRGTPTRSWLDHEMYHLFGIRYKLATDSADYIYDQICEKLQDPAFCPRALFDRFKIEVLTTTDGAADRLEHHQALRQSSWKGRVIPCFRPDAVFKIADPVWRAEFERLGESSGMVITGYDGFLRALERRRDFFRSMGAVSTDHAVETPRTHLLPALEADRLFQRALQGEANGEDEAAFQAHMLMEMARMSSEDGMVMQIHPGSYRNHNRGVYRRFGPDAGADIPLTTEYTRNLEELLNAYGNDPRFRLVIFTLDEATYSRELAPLAGHYPSLYLGPAWWFFDSIEGMTRYRRLVTETAGIYNTAGFNDDTRAFLSIPARHDLSRRVDANYLAGLVARHIIDLEEALEMAQALAYDQARRVYRLNEGEE